MNEGLLGNLSEQEKKRLAYIEGRPDLFETKVFKIIPQTGAGREKNLLVTSRDPGSCNALLPVLRELHNDSGLQINLITDGRAQEIIQKNFIIEDVTPENSVLEADKIVGPPNAILIDRSSETGIDSYVIATYKEVPIILVEDYYSNTLGFLKKIFERGLPWPEKICVMDQGAKEIIVEKFPELEDIIEITGQPAFDRFNKEDTKQITAEVKEKLGLSTNDKLVSYMSTIDELEKVRLIAEELKRVGGNFYFAFRRHPRDNVPYEEFRKILIDAGIRVVDTDEFSTDQIGAASDVILTNWSTEGLNGIYRRKPTVHITDQNFRIPENLLLPLVPIKLGASIGINDVNELSGVLDDLLDSKSEINKKLKENMEKYYPADGKNAQRVASIVRRYLN